MAVFHTNEAGKIGPTRSARYSDPPILAMFGTPLFGWSGANKGVTRAVESSPWINNVNWNAHPKDYARDRSRTRAAQPVHDHQAVPVRPPRRGPAARAVPATWPRVRATPPPRRWPAST